jgi:hypothetical protein
VYHNYSPVTILAALTLCIDLFHAENLDDWLSVYWRVVAESLLAKARCERARHVHCDTYESSVLGGVTRSRHGGRVKEKWWVKEEKVVGGD